MTDISASAKWIVNHLALYCCAVSRYVLIVVAMMLAPVSVAETTRWETANLNGVEQTLVESDATGKTYRIQIAAIGDEPKTGYPTLFLLDGDILLPMAALMMQALAVRLEYQQGVLLVGVGYPSGKLYDLKARAHDYTPSLQDQAAGTGGAKQFRQFLHKELKPLISNRYAVNKKRMALMGHSYGGLYALYNLFNFAEDFQVYLISSPSIWWGAKRVLQDESQLHQAPAMIRITAAEYEQTSNPKSPDSPKRLAKKSQRKMVDQAKALSQRLQQRFPKAAIELQIYAGEDHGSVVPRSLQDCLKAWYKSIYR